MSKHQRYRRNKSLRKQQKDSADETLFAELDQLIEQNNAIPDHVNESNAPAPEQPKAAPGTKTISEIIKMASDMYAEVKAVAASTDFTKLEDKRKLDYFRNKHKEFMEEYPIITRWMICLGQYSNKAFKRYLEKVASTVHPPPDKREKGYMEDQWIRRQADYVRFLWEAYQKGHINPAESNYIWNDAYKTLKGEFDDFRDKYKEVEENVKKEKEVLKSANAKDLLQRLASGEQTLDEKDSEKLMMLLKERVHKRRAVNVMAEIVSKVKKIPPSYEAFGTGPEEKVIPKDAPVIRMIEYVDENRMSEVPKHLLLDDETRSKLPPIMEDREM